MRLSIEQEGIVLLEMLSTLLIDAEGRELATHQEMLREIASVPITREQVKRLLLDTGLVTMKVVHNFNTGATRFYSLTPEAVTQMLEHRTAYKTKQWLDERLEQKVMAAAKACAEDAHTAMDNHTKQIETVKQELQSKEQAFQQAMQETRQLENELWGHP